MDKNVKVSRIKNYSDLNKYFLIIQGIAHLFATAKMINLKTSIHAYLRPPPIEKISHKKFLLFRIRTRVHRSHLAVSK